MNKNIVGLICTIRYNLHHQQVDGLGQKAAAFNRRQMEQDFEEYLMRDEVTEIGLRRWEEVTGL